MDGIIDTLPSWVIDFPGVETIHSRVVGFTLLTLVWLLDSPDYFPTVKRMVLWNLVILRVIWWRLLPFVKRFCRVRLDAFRFSRCTLMMLRPRRYLPKNLVQRACVFESLKAALKGHDFFTTVILYGPRGAGKKRRTIKSVLQNRKGVVVWWKLTANTYRSATAQLEKFWEELFVPMDRTYSEDACRRVLHKYGRPLVIVVSVEAHAEPTALTSLLYWCKVMSYNKRHIRFVTDVSDPPVALNATTDFVSLRVREVLVGPLTLQEPHSFLMNRLPIRWTDMQRQEVSLDITSRLGCVAREQNEICKKCVDDMSTDDALTTVRNTHRAKRIQALNRLKEFDSLVATNLEELPNRLPPPSLKNTKGLDEDGLRELIGFLGFSGFKKMIEELGYPGIFEIDPFVGSDIERSSNESSVYGALN
mmetsp:Transcript_44801/g.108703  ORF Transcript_44801/g.108703 Transcript_44801/m.108703 type:complete len:419 (+) Transcript_44801:641-1897(+)